MPLLLLLQLLLPQICIDKEDFIKSKKEVKKEVIEAKVVEEIHRSIESKEDHNY